ncbi:hypothetical protein FRB94_012141 [Tulasnella sp. JGI-2019a]|nr:hypothetical protein FRB94_012141 [Tulasnella sp. JGI-2019a]
MLPLIWSAPVAIASVPSVSTLRSSVTLLYHNNLNYTDDSNHVGALLLDGPLTLSSAMKACATLGEALLPAAVVQSHPADIAPELSYLAYQKQYGANQAFWIGNNTAVLLNSDGTLKITQPAVTTSLPVLCSQSALGTTQSTSLPTSNNLIQVVSNSNTFAGYRNLKSFQFPGIPYTNPTPRFTYPTLYNATNKFINATEFGPVCVQAGVDIDISSEQCQYLNVFTPYIPVTKAKLKPVLFWIHGGGLTSGAGSDPTFDGGNMGSRGDIVVVTINYRLSTLGWLALPNTTITGNYGLADQITALDWVRENIAAFGGDKDRITIGGQSSGANSVRLLLGSPRAIGKYSAAILESDVEGLYGYAAGTTTLYTPEEEAAIGGYPIVNATNCNSTGNTAVVNCILGANATDLATLGVLMGRFPIVDGNYITTSQLQVTGNGPTAHVPTLWGNMADDAAAIIGALSGYPTVSMNVSQAIQTMNTIPSNLTDSIISSGLFPVPNMGDYTLDLFNVSSRVGTDDLFRCLNQATVHSAVRHGVFSTSYYYQFDQSYQAPTFDVNAPVCDPPKTAAHPLGDLSLPYLRCHSGDLFYEFGSLGQFGLPIRDAKDVALTQLVMDYWTSFVRTHDPNPDSAYLVARNYTSTMEQIRIGGHWDPVSTASNALHVLSIPSKQGVFSEIEQCAVLGLPIDYFESQ